MSWGLGASAVVAGAIGGATAGAINTGINGGNPFRNIFGGALIGGIAGAISGPTFGALGGGPTAGAMANFFASVGTGATVGAITGAISTGIYGGKFGRNVAFGALGGAVTAAGMFVVNSAIASQWDSFKASVKGAEISTTPLIEEQIGNFEKFSKVDMSGVQVFEANLAPNVQGANTDANSILINKTVVAGAESFNGSSIRDLVNVIGHELTHMIQSRASLFAPLRYFISHHILGYTNNPFESQAWRTGNAFEAHVLP